MPFGASRRRTDHRDHRRRPATHRRRYATAAPKAIPPEFRLSKQVAEKKSGSNAVQGSTSDLPVPIGVYAASSQSGVVPVSLSAGGIDPTGSVGMATRVHSHNQNGPVPDRMFAKFTFVDGLSQSALTAGFQGAFASNDIFNCFIGDTDSWANYFLHYSRLYQKFRVYASRFKQHIWVKADQTQEFVVGVFPWVGTDDDFDPASLQNLLSMPNEHHITFTPLPGENSYHCLEHYMKTGTLDGVLDISDSPGYEGSFAGIPNYDSTSPSASPIDLETWRTFAYPTQAVAPATPSYTFITEIEYYVEMFGVKPPNTDPNPEFAHKSLPPVPHTTPEEPLDLTPDLSDSVLVDRIVKAVKAAK